MKKALSILICLTLLIFCPACTAVSLTVPTASPTPAAAAVSPSEPGQLLLKYVPQYARGFHIEYYTGGARIIDTHIAATANTAAAAQRLLILPAGAADPLNTTWDLKIEGFPDRVITLSSSHAGHFANLAASDCIVGTSIKVDNCYIPSLKAALLSGKTQYVGAGAKADQELIAALKPQLIFVGGMQSDVELAQKLEESGLACFYFGDFAETGYMGRAQWIELVGAIIGKEQQAQDFVQSCEQQIQAIISRAKAVGTSPKVLWLTQNSSAPHWNIRTSLDYVNSIVSAVGGQLYCPADATTNAVALANENFLQYMQGADKIIYGVSLNSYPEAKNMTYFNKDGQIDFAAAPAYQKNECYVVGYDWAQDTADALSIIKSIAICLYPDEFKDLENPGKIISFQVK